MAKTEEKISKIEGESTEIILSEQQRIKKKSYFNEHNLEDL